jgi:MraZ protein
MPRKFRSSIGETFVITKGPGCLFIMTVDRLHAIYREAQKLGDPLSVMFDPQARRLHHQLFSEMSDTKCDGQGRVPLTPELRVHAGIDKDVVLVGCGDWIELWSQEQWEEYNKTDMTSEQIIAAVSQAQSRREGGEAGAGVSPSGSS